MVRIHPDPPEFAGAVAQLGEHLLCKQGVVGSIPSSSTNREPGCWPRCGPGVCGTESRSKRQRCPVVPFASGLLNQCYRLFFNNAEEVKQILPDGREWRRKPFFSSVGRDGLDCIEPVFSYEFGGNG